MCIRPAEDKDLPTIIEWRAERAGWLAERGEDQWSEVGLSSDEFVDRVALSIQQGETWMLVDHEPGTRSEQVKGTIAIDQWSDDGLWSEGQLANSVITHRMIVPVAHAGHRIGDRLLSFATELARRAGKQFVRLDAWTSNRHLHAYYQRQGFRHVRTDTTRRSGALFELPVPSAKPLPWESADRPWFEPISDSGHRHVAQPWRFLPHLRVQHSSIAAGCPSVTDADRYRLRWDGVSWRWCDLNQAPHLDHKVLTLPADLQLDTNYAYDIHPIEPVIEDHTEPATLERSRA